MSGFIYNDLKTDNIMFGADGCSDVKLIDFGFA